MPCADCGAATVWDDDAAADLCPHCGTLADYTQTLLTSSPASTSHVVPNAPLKSLRRGHQWDLAGQSSEAREFRNTLAIEQLIRSLAASLRATVVTPRAQTLFAQARAAHPGFRWGIHARRLAGASLAAALRESRLPAAVHDIAFLLSEPVSALTRAFVSLTALLRLPPTPSDPTVYLPKLTAFLAAPQPPLPPALTAQLRPLDLHSVTNTATALARLLARHGTDHPLNRLPTAPTACALLLLALESEARTPLKPLADFAHTLAPHVHVSGHVIMDRYKAVQDEVTACIERVPWLAKPLHGKRGKVGKRTMVARGLHDVVQFQEEIWKGQLKPIVVLDVSDNEDVRGDPTPRPAEALPKQQRKRKKTSHQPLHDAAQFLLNPITSPLITFDSTSSPSETSPLALASYLLNAPSLFNSCPTRLQLLAALRAGGEAAITEDELFAPGELEGIFRGTDEVREIRKRYEELGLWGPSEDNDTEEQESGKTLLGRRKKNPDMEKRPGRIDLDALARFMQEGPVHDDGEKGDDEMFLGLERFGEKGKLGGGNGNDGVGSDNIDDYKGSGPTPTPDASAPSFVDQFVDDQDWWPLTSAAGIPQYEE